MRYNRLFANNNNIVPTGYTQELSSYAAGLRFEDIPAHVRERAKFILLQTLGVSLAAANTPLAVKARQLGLEANNGVGGDTTAWISGERVSAVNAALIAGTLSDILDWEDCSWTGHPSAGIIPVAWITAEERHKGGKELIRAIVVAYELYQRIAMAAQPSPQGITNGWGLTSWQIFGASLAAASIYGFDARKIDQTIGISAECSTIPACYHAVTMSDFYHYEHGYRARDGVLLAKAVEKGFHNQRDALDDPNGYLSAISDAPKPEWLTKGLGSRFLILETLLKHWPANMWVQSATEAVAEIVRAHGVKAEDVEEIIIDPGNGDRMWAPEDGFHSITHAEFSTPYVIAAFLHNNTPGAHWYTPETMQNPDVIALARRVKSGPSPLDYPEHGFALFREGKYPLKHVTLTTRDGRILTANVDCHPGHPANMFSQEQLVERFRLQASPVLQSDRLERTIDALLNIEQTNDIAALSGLLVKQR